MIIRKGINILNPAFISIYTIILVLFFTYYSSIDLTLIHSLFYYYPLRDKIIEFTGEEKYLYFIAKGTKEHKDKVLTCWNYRENIDKDIRSKKVRIDSIPNDSFISKQYYSEKKLVKIYFARKFKSRIEETSYYFRNDSLILGRFYVYLDSIKSIREINDMKPKEIYTSFIRNDSVIYESEIPPSTRHGASKFLAIREYEHANCITLNRLKLRYPCPNDFLPRKY